MLSAKKFKVSTHGIIAIGEVDSTKLGNKLDMMSVHGVAPFFAPMDLRKGGQISVDETSGWCFFDGFDKSAIANAEVLIF